MAFLPPMTGFAPPPQLGQPVPAAVSAARPGAAGGPMGNYQPMAGAAMGGFPGSMPESPATVDPSQFGIKPPPGPEVNPVQPLPGVRPSGVMPMQPSAGGAMRPPNAGFVHPAVGRLRGMPTQAHGRPY